VGVFAKVMLAIAILVANGVLLFVILRFLLWLAFPGRDTEDEDAAAVKPVFAAGAGGAAVAAAELAPSAAGAAVPPAPPPAPPPGGPPALVPMGRMRARAYPHRLLIGLPVILALFAGGVWLGSVVGGSGSAAAATRTVRVTGSVITVNHTTEVRVPAQKVRVKGTLVSVPATTVHLPSQIVTNTIRTTHTTVIRLPGQTRTTTTTIAIPTTVLVTGTTVTSTETTTLTVTTTDTNSTSTTT
jgi:hypothetical protein